MKSVVSVEMSRNSFSSISFVIPTVMIRQPRALWSRTSSSSPFCSTLSFPSVKTMRTFLAKLRSPPSGVKMLSLAWRKAPVRFVVPGVLRPGLQGHSMLSMMFCIAVTFKVWSKPKCSVALKRPQQNVLQAQLHGNSKRLVMFKYLLVKVTIAKWFSSGETGIRVTTVFKKFRSVDQWSTWGLASRHMLPDTSARSAMSRTHSVAKIQ